MNTVKDTDYAYIDTFIGFLSKIVDVIEKLVGVIGGAFEKFSK